MRSAGLAKLLRGVMASVVPIVSLNGCVGEECYGDDERHQKYLTVRENGQIIELSDNPPNLPDASVGSSSRMAVIRKMVMQAMGSTAHGLATGWSMAVDCGQSGTVLGCRSLGRADGRFFASCDIQFKPVCMPAGVQCGRRTAGLWVSRSAASDSAETAVGRVLAEMAALEAASVGAFRVLARELEAHGAPQRLCLAARRAAADEIRHACIMRALARRRGAIAPKVRMSRRAQRSLLQIAVENCVEGCVRETFGALVATWQARQARDPELRRAMRVIARDEVRHAALAHRIAVWLERQLDAEQRAVVDAAKQRAVADLRRELAGGAAAPDVATAAGFPTVRQARQLIDGLERALWQNGRLAA